MNFPLDSPIMPWLKLWKRTSLDLFLYIKIYVFLGSMRRKVTGSSKLWAFPLPQDRRASHTVESSGKEAGSQAVLHDKQHVGKDAKKQQTSSWRGLEITAREIFLASLREGHFSVVWTESMTKSQLCQPPPLLPKLSLVWVWPPQALEEN